MVARTRPIVTLYVHCLSCSRWEEWIQRKKKF